MADLSSLIPAEARIDQQLVVSTLSRPPFVSVEGVFNFRDFGAGYPITSATPTRIKPNHLFRSGQPSRITSRGIEQLRALGIRKVFDLRADIELAKYGSANLQIEGVEVVRASILDEAMDPVTIALRLKEFSSNEAEAFLKMNTRILQSGGDALERILVHLRDNPGEPCLIHCTAGKDRAGMLSAMILMLLGASDEDIVQDYTLTTIGLQPVLPLLVARFQKEAVYRDNWQGTINLATAKPEAMRSILEIVRTEYGGADEFLKRYTKLTDADITRIRENLLVPF